MGSYKKKKIVITLSLSVTPRLWGLQQLKAMAKPLWSVVCDPNPFETQVPKSENSGSHS